MLSLSPIHTLTVEHHEVSTNSQVCDGIGKIDGTDAAKPWVGEFSRFCGWKTRDPGPEWFTPAGRPPASRNDPMSATRWSHPAEALCWDITD